MSVLSEQRQHRIQTLDVEPNAYSIPLRGNQFSLPRLGREGLDRFYTPPSI